MAKSTRPHCECSKLHALAKDKCWSGLRCPFCIDNILESKNEVIRENVALRVKVEELTREVASMQAVIASLQVDREGLHRYIYQGEDGCEVVVIASSQEESLVMANEWCQANNHPNGLTLQGESNPLLPGVFGGGWDGDY